MGVLDQPLDVQRAVAERRQRLAPRGLDRLVRSRRPCRSRRMPLPPPPAEALTSAGSRPLDGAPNARVRLILRHVAGDDRHAGRLPSAAAPRSSIPCCAMTAGAARRTSGRPARTPRRTPRSRRGSRIPGGWRRRRRSCGAADHRGNREIALGCWRRADADGRDRPAVHVQAPCVRIRVHRDALDAELAARADDPDRDLAAVRDQEPVSIGDSGLA